MQMTEERIAWRDRLKVGRTTRSPMRLANVQNCHGPHEVAEGLKWDSSTIMRGYNKQQMLAR